MQTLNQLKQKFVAIDLKNRSLTREYKRDYFKSIRDGISQIEKNAFSLPLYELRGARALLADVEDRIKKYQ